MISRMFKNALRLIAIAVTLVGLLASSSPDVHAQDTPRAKELAQKADVRLRLQPTSRPMQSRGLHVFRRPMIKELDQDVARNESDDLTLQAFVQEYGPTVLSEPPAKGFNVVAWIVPIAAPLLALYVLWEVVRRWRQRAALMPAEVALPFPLNFCASKANRAVRR